MANHEHCESILGDLSAYLDEEASVALCAEIDKHLAGCGDCQVVVDTLRRTVTLYQTLPQPAMPESLRKRLYKTFDLGDLLPRDTE